MARYKRQRAAPLERFDRVEGFDATGVSGTVVTVASDAVTVQPDSVGAQCVVVARVGSGATIIPPVIPAADPDGDAVVRVPRFGQLERGDTVRAMVAGAEVHALVQGVSQSGALNCFLWQRVDELPAALQFYGLSHGASFPGSVDVLELVLTTTRVLVEPAAVLGQAWACSAEQFLTGAVTGLAFVFFANLYFNGDFLQRLAEAFYEDSSSQQALILLDRIAVADCVAQCLRKMKGTFSLPLRVTPHYWPYLAAVRLEAVVTRAAVRTVSRPAVGGGDISTQGQTVLARMGMTQNLEVEVREVCVRIGRNAITGAGSGSRRFRARADGDGAHTLRRVDLAWNRATSTLQVKVTSVKIIAGRTTSDDAPSRHSGLQGMRDAGEAKTSQRRGLRWTLRSLWLETCHPKRWTILGP